jgi:outer membrane protein assembly factor BamB
LKVKGKWLNHKVPLIIAAILAIGLVSSGCIRGVAPVGWSGGAVSGGTLYVGSHEGRLVAINLSDESRQFAEPLKAVTQSGMFGCAPAGGGCGAGVSRVAIYGTPVVVGDLVYIAGYNGEIHAYNISNISSERWVYPRKGNLEPFVGGLVVVQDKLIIGNADGKVYALDSATGDKKWEFVTDDKIWATPAIDGDTVYIGSFDKKLYALNVSDGSKKWEFDAGGAIISTPLVYNGMIYIGSFDRNLYAISTANGNLKWKFTGKSWFWAEPVVFNDNIYAGCLDGNMYVLKAGTGEKVKAFELESGISSQPVMVDSSIIFATRKGVIYSIDTASQEIKQIADIKTDVDGPLMAYEGVIYIHTQALELQRINAASGALLRPISLKS